MTDVITDSGQGRLSITSTYLRESYGEKLYEYSLLLEYTKGEIARHKVEARQNMQLFANLFPILNALSFIPCAISTLSYLENQVPCLWMIVSLLAIDTVYLTLCIITYFILPALSDRLQMRFEAQYDEFFVDNGDLYGPAEDRRPLSVSFTYLQGSNDQLCDIKAKLFAQLDKEKHMRIIINDKILFNTLTLVLSISIIFLLIYFEKSSNFDQSAILQLGYTTWLLLVDILITAIAFTAR